MERKQKKWWQRSLAFMLSLVLVISSFLAGGMPVSYAADGEINREVYVSDGGSDLGDGSRGNPFKTLTKAYEKVASGGTIYVSGKITLLHPFPKFDGKNVTITTAPEDKETAVIQRGAVGGIGTGTLFDLYNGHFILKKIIIDGSFGEDKSEGRIINLNINTILTIEEGTVLRNNFSKYPGSAVILNNASAVAEMTGGEIINNKHDSTGAVHINSSGAKFTMTGGKITGNSGGGVQVKDGEFNLSGNADITGNTIGNSERNVYLEGTKLLTLSGEFTGKAGITALNRMTAREQFGKANVGDLKGIENLIADNNPLLFAGYGENNALIWQELNVTITSPTGTVKNGKPTFTGTATPGATLTVKVGKNITLTAQADKDGNWSVTPETNIPDGAYTVEVSASIDDKISTPVTKEITVDTITSDGPAITTSPGDTVAVIVNNKIENGAVVVDAGVTLDSSVLNGYEDNLNGATVAIENFKAEDKLEYTNVNGITGNFNPATGILTLSGKASIEDYQAILRSVTFTTTSTDQTDRNITFTLGSALAFSENGHFYEYINKDAPITWFNAKKEAEEKNYFGRKGYLVTITGKNENNFVKEKTLGLGWIGAKDIERNVDNNPDGGTFPKQIGDWRWVTGPEGLIDQGKGLKFYTGYSPGKIEPDMYSNWQSGEPNDYNGIGEYVAHIFGPKESNPGQWNDYRPNDPSVKGYVIEYGGMPEDENFALSASKKIVFVEAPTVEIIKPEGDKITTSKPIFEGSVTKGSEVTVEIKDKAGNVIDTPTVTVNPDGTWSFEPTKDLPDGDYTVEVTAEKNGKTATETKEVTVDTTVLTVGITEPIGDKVATAKPEFKGTANPGSTVTVAIKDKVGNVIDTPTVTVNPDGTWSFEPTKDLPDGDYTVEVTAEKNGKTATETKAVTVDTTALTVGITEPIGDKVATAKPEFKGTATPGSTVTVAIKDKVGNVIDTPTVTVNPDGTWSFEPTKDLPDGDYTVEVTAEKNGKTATETKEVTVDTTVLTVGITEPIGDKVATAKPEFKGTANPGSTVTVAIKDKVGNIIDTPTVTVNPDGTWSFEPTKDLPDGDYTVEVTAEKNGKTATETKAVTVDTTALTVGITEPIGDKVATAKPEFKGTATPGSTVTVAIKDKVGNVIDTPTVTVNPDGTWSFEPTKDLPDGDYTVEITAEKDGETTSINKTITINTKTPPVLTPGLGSLIPSQGTLSPSFSSEVTDYTMNVDYATSQLSFLATPIIPGASVTTTVNGQLGTLGQIPLQVGENIIVITVADGYGNVKHYTLKVYREAYTGGGNSGGGGTWTPDPTPPVTPTPSETKTKIQVELEIDGDNPLEKTTVEIERTKHANGDVTDFVNLTPAQALEAVEKAKQIGNSIARIVIPDVKDEVDKVTVEVPKQSLQTLRDNGLSLEISTENGHIAIPHSSMEGIDDNFYFRLVPVKKESERQAIEERAKAEQVVHETLESDDVHVVARPMTIETNMPSRPVQVTLPLKGVNVPTVAAERQAFLDQLAIFIEHSDGEKKVVFPEVVTMAKGELGLRFTVEKFSTFTIIQFEKPEVSEHEAYIKGFPNGTFGPDKNVTRAQVAIMMARILGYTEVQAVDKAPFKDVAKDHSAAGAIAFVKEQGIMNGDQYGNFHANANITRAEMAAVVANYKQLSVEEGVPITFKDTKGHWAQWIIEANRASGIINGLEDGSFAPNAALTRAQAVVMMNRMFERGPLQGVAKPSFPDVKATHWAFKEIEEAANSHKYFIDEDGKEQLSK